MFWLFGLKNAWRNLSRSGLAILSMALAAGFMTNAISLSRGSTLLYKADYRSFIGGEIVAYAPQFSGRAPEAGAIWSYQATRNMQNTNLESYRPELLQNGFLTTLSEVVPFSDNRLEEFATMDGVEAVYPYYRFPAYVGGESTLWQAPLRGRVLELDQMQAKPPSQMIADGRWFVAEDEGALVAVVSAKQRLPPGEKAVAVGDVLRLLLPRIHQSGAEIRYDFADPLEVRLSVIGTLDLVSRTIVREDPKKPVIYITRYEEEIQLPISTWQELWRLAGGDAYLPQQASIIVPDVSFLEDIVVTFQSSFPEHTFYSVVQMAEDAEARLLLENPLEVEKVQPMSTVTASRGSEMQSGLPMDMRLPLIALIFANAALVIAGNLLILASERKSEIGILKTVGARRSEVMQMVLAEALLISGIGAVAGFLLFRLPAMLNQMTNRIAFGLLLRSLAVDLLLVLAASGIAALVFGMLPALRMANLSVLEVLREE